MHETRERITKHYSACMDSVNLIKNGKPARMTPEDWADCLERNKEHLRIMLSREYWTTEDLVPLRAASL